ncbi:MAG: PspC domain-containing protein [Anaerolineales bacterium]|nr:PspC domain-containing protein [Anaerolineales bacterium]
MSEKRLVRRSEDRMLFGVAGGVADYLNVDPVIVRLVFVLLALFGKGLGVLLYIVLAIVMREEVAPAAKANPFDEEEIIIKDA